MDTLTYVAAGVCVLLFLYIIFDSYNAVPNDEQLPTPSMDSIPDPINK